MQDQNDIKPPSPLSIDDFANKIKEQYPAYKDIDNATLTKKVLVKYPVYKDRVESPFQPLGDDPLSTIRTEAKAHGLGVGSTSRSASHNKAVGGAANSYHLYGQAADIVGDHSKFQQFHDYMEDKYGTNLAELIYGTADHLDHVHVAWNALASQRASGPPITSESGDFIYPTPTTKQITKTSIDKDISDFSDSISQGIGIEGAKQKAQELKNKWGNKIEAGMGEGGWAYVKPASGKVLTKGSITPKWNLKYDPNEATNNTGINLPTKEQFEQNVDRVAPHDISTTTGKPILTKRQAPTPLTPSQDWYVKEQFKKSNAPVQTPTDFQVQQYAAGELHKRQMEEEGEAEDSNHWGVTNTLRHGVANLGTKLAETTANIGGQAGKLLRLVAEPSRLYKEDQPDPISDWQQRISQTSQDISQRNKPDELQNRILGEVGALAPKMLGGLPGFVTTEYADTLARTGSHQQAIESAATALATAKLGGGLAKLAEREGAKGLEAYVERALANAAAPSLIRGATTGNLSLSPSDIAFGALFGLGGGKTLSKEGSIDAYLSKASPKDRAQIISNVHTMLDHPDVPDEVKSHILDLLDKNKDLERRLNISEEARNTDEGTGLQSKAAFNSKQKNGKTLAENIDADPNRTVIAHDMNGFKPVNDTLGHPVGDEVLKEYGARLKAEMPDASHFRTGGDEFTTVINHPEGQTPEARQAQIDEAVRKIKSIEIKKLDKNGNELKVTASAGAGDTNEAADKAMYEDKKAYKAGLGVKPVEEASPTESLEDKIHKAYLELADNKYGNQVSIAELKAKLKESNLNLKEEDINKQLLDMQQRGAYIDSYAHPGMVANERAQFGEEVPLGLDRGKEGNVLYLEKPTAGPQERVTNASSEAAPPVEVAEAQPTPSEAPTPSQPLWSLSPSELSSAYKQAYNADTNLLQNLFGKEGAARYNKLQRKANSSYTSTEDMNKALDEVGQMENKLTKAQQDKLFGINVPENENHEIIKNYIDALSAIDDSSPEALADSIKYAITKIGDKNSPNDMNHSEQLAYAQLRHAFNIAKEKGWDTAEISKLAAEAAAARWHDPEDAAFMLDRFIKKPKQLETDSTLEPPKPQVPELESKLYNNLTKGKSISHLVSPELEAKLLEAHIDDKIKSPKDIQAILKAHEAEGNTIADINPAEPPTDETGTSVGAAHPSNFPTDPAIAQLSRELRGLTRSAPAENRTYTLGEKLGMKVSAAKEVINNSVKNLVNMTKRVGASLKSPIRDESSFLDNLHAWNYDKEMNAGYTQQFAREIRKIIPSQLDREALARYVDANGDSTVLTEGKTNALARGDNITAKQYDSALNLTQAEKDIALRVQSYFDAVLQEAQDNGLMDSALPNYINRVYGKDAAQAATARIHSEASSGSLPTNFSHAKQRFYQYLKDAEAAGKKTKTVDIADLIPIYNQEMGDVIAARKFVGANWDSTIGPGGEPMLIPAGLGTPGDNVAGTPTLINPNSKPRSRGHGQNKITINPQDYVPYDHPAFRKWDWAASDSEGNPIIMKKDALVHKDFIDEFKRRFDPSAFDKSPVLRAIKQVKNQVKATIMIGGFHELHIDTHALMHRIWNPYTNFKGEIDLGDPNELGITPEQAQARTNVRRAIQAGVKVFDSHGSQAFAEGLASGAWVHHLPLAGPLLQRYSEWLFQDHIPKIKIEYFNQAVDRNLSKYSKDIAAGKVTAKQIERYTAEQTNASFGELNNTILGTSKTTQDMLGLLLLAPDFTRARVQYLKQALQPYGREQRIAMIGGAIAMYSTARVLNAVINNGQTYASDPDKAFKVHVGDHWIGIRSVPEDVLNFIEKPGQSFMNRLNPLLQSGKTLIEGTNRYGKELDPDTKKARFIEASKSLKPFAIDPSLSKSIIQFLGLTESKFNPAEKILKKKEQTIEDLMEKSGQKRKVVERELHKF